MIPGISKPAFTQVKGTIRRRILLNYAADPTAVQPLLPEPFRPKLQNGRAVVGVCLIRLEDMRPGWMPVRSGISSENSAHRMAVKWTDEAGVTREGVYIPRRDTDSRFNHLVGGRLFPGEHQLADFDVSDSGEEIAFLMRSKDGAADLDLRLRSAEGLPAKSVFSSLAEASRFFEGGCDGFSPRAGKPGVDGLRLCVDSWSVTPLQVDHARSAFYDNEAIFPAGSIVLDHAQLMRDVPHEWRDVGDNTGA